MKSGGEIKEKLNEMKTTKQRLSEVFCRPTTEEWNNPILLKCRSFFSGMDVCGVGHFNQKDRTEITVDKFIDLINDTIADWRLQEDGFKVSGNDLMLSMNAHTLLFVTKYGIFIRATSASDEVEVWCNGIKTHTQLITLIELIG